MFYLSIAGKNALARQANPEAVRHLRQALDLIDGMAGESAGQEPDPQMAPVGEDIVKSLARAEAKLGNYQASVDQWRRAAAGARARDDIRQLARIHREIGLALFWDDRLEEAQEEF